MYEDYHAKYETKERIPKNFEETPNFPENNKISITDVMNRCNENEIVADQEVGRTTK